MFMRPCATWLGIYISNSLSDKGGANEDKKKDTKKKVSKIRVDTDRVERTQYHYHQPKGHQIAHSP